MLTTRRKKKKAGKERARIAKHAKKLKKQGPQTAGADSSKAGPP
jgi:hypothetical protein